MASHEPTFGRLVALLSDSYAASRRALGAAPVVSDDARTALQLQRAALALAQEIEDDVAEGMALIRYGRTLPWHARQRRAHLRLVQQMADEPLDAA